LKKILRYTLFVFSLVTLVCSCKKRLDKRVSLWRMDKIPYGAKYSCDNLPYIFPGAVIHTSDRFPVLFHTEGEDNRPRALIILSPLFAPEPDDLHSIIRFAASGNQVFISALDFDDSVMRILHLKWKENFFQNDSMETSIFDPARNDWVKYIYPGFNTGYHFDSLDTVHAAVLGKDARGRPDFIRIPYAHGGAIFIHLDPFVFSNFFLLYGRNKSYYDLAFSWMPKNIVDVEWSDYFRYRRNQEAFSAFHFILANRSLRWAFWLTLILFLLMFLIEYKRKQRPIAEIPALRNASEDFVKTVGRLYFQQKNNQNLATKMITTFLENIRSSYNLSTSLLNEEFARKLAFRTGRPVNEIMHLIQFIHDVRLNQEVTDEQVMDLHQKINQFTKPV